MIDQKASNSVKDKKILQIKIRNLKYVIQCYDIVQWRFGTTPQRALGMGNQHTNQEHWGEQSEPF